MTNRTQLQRLGRSELEALAEKALTARERNRQAASKVRKAKKEAGLQQITIWLPRGHPDIEWIKRHAEAQCEKHLANLAEGQASPKKSNDLQGQNPAAKSPVNAAPKSPDGQGV